MVGLILLAALQRRRRGIHISTMLRPDQVPTGATLAELRAARGTSLDLTSTLEVGADPGLAGSCSLQTRGVRMDPIVLKLTLEKSVGFELKLVQPCALVDLRLAL